MEANVGTASGSHIVFSKEKLGILDDNDFCRCRGQSPGNFTAEFYF